MQKSNNKLSFILKIGLGGHFNFKNDPCFKNMHDIYLENTLCLYVKCLKSNSVKRKSNRGSGEK